jgi:hypothetical protein
MNRSKILLTFIALCAGAYILIQAHAQAPLMESPPSLKIQTANGSLVVQSRDDRELVIERVLVNNKEVDISNWKPHEVRSRNPEYVAPPGPNIKVMIEKRPETPQEAASRNALRAQYDALPDSKKQEYLAPIMTSDDRRLSMGDIRTLFVMANVVKVEIVTDHGTWTGESK